MGSGELVDRSPDASLADGPEQPFNGKVVERLRGGMRILEVVGEGTGIAGSEIICDKSEGVDAGRGRENCQVSITSGH